MQINPYFRAATAAALGGCASFAFVATAWAAPVSTTTIDINPGNVPATAADYEHECGDNLGGGPYPGKDVWVFNLPGNAGKTGAFTEITATFDTDGAGDRAVVIEAGAADGDDIVFVGHSKAYAITTAGWTLVGATATITGQADKFVLTHTCAAPSTPPTTTKPATTPPTTTPATTTRPPPRPGPPPATARRHRPGPPSRRRRRPPAPGQELAVACR
ncbi:hypothetical protein [Actinoplanes sp. NPDC049599]|uniref:hypothetical protein n=1 Tax=Actinoplanes sp. NPDC049599 TaxID=3363903 RepID=UPI0037B6AAF3